jgi:hypothetical protein
MPEGSDPRVPRPVQRRHRLGAAAGLFALIAWRVLRGERIYMLPRRATVHATPQDGTNPIITYERSDWSVGPVAIVYAGILALLVICCFVLIAAYPTSLPDADRSLRIEPPGPRLQTNPGADLARFRADEQKRLDTYYWIDRQQGTVHIPIGEAMKKVVQTGIPGFPKIEP